MRSIIFILAMFGMLMLQPNVSSAENYIECLTRCNADKSSSDANCPPPPGDEARAQCLKENQDAMKPCIDSCQQAAAGATAPKDRPMDTPKDIPDTPKEN